MVEAGAMRRAAKRDTSEPDIIRTLERCGFFVLRVSVKDGPDLLAFHPVLGPRTVHLIECKSGTKKLRPGQQQFAETWPVTVLRCVDSTLAWVKGMQE
jgi:hypothetical protein